MSDRPSQSQSRSSADGSGSSDPAMVIAVTGVPLPWRARGYRRDGSPATTASTATATRMTGHVRYVRYEGHESVRALGLETLNLCHWKNAWID